MDFIDANLLAEIIRWLGVAVALLGTCATVPAATWGLLRGFRQKVVNVARRIAGRPRHATVHAGTAAGTVHLTATARGKLVPAMDATVQHRLDLLEQWLDRLDTEVGQMGADLRTETSQRKAEDRRLAHKLDGEIARLGREIEEREQESVQINARALPVVGVGIVLSGVPENLAAWAPLGLTAAALGAALSFYALVLVIRGRPQTQAQNVAAT